MHNQMVNINIVQLFNATCVRLYYTIIEKKLDLDCSAVIFFLKLLSINNQEHSNKAQKKDLLVFITVVIKIKAWTYSYLKFCQKEQHKFWSLNCSRFAKPRQALVLSVCWCLPYLPLQRGSVKTN